MGTKSGVCKFAEKWLLKFNDPNTTYTDLVDHYLADDCDALGFEMDCGEAFRKAYGPEAYENADRVREIKVSEEDIPALGSGIYSKWRGFNHWADYAEEIMKPRNRLWFIGVLEKLAEASDGLVRLPLIEGKLNKLQLKSNTIRYAPEPDPEDEVEQHLTVMRDGRIFFSSYAFGDGWKYQRITTKNYKTDPDKTGRVLDLVKSYFSYHFPLWYIDDGGRWELTLEDEEGNVFPFAGSEGPIFLDDGTDLSEDIREELNRDDLFLFDGNRYDQINRIEISYHFEEKGYRNRDEALIMDRETGDVTCKRRKDSFYTVSKVYHMPELLSGFLDTMYADELFVSGAGPAPDAELDLKRTCTYSISVTYKKKPGMSFSGSFDKKGLPRDFPDFIHAVKALLKDPDEADLFDPVFYEKLYPKDGEVIYCSVAFNDTKKTYYYQTDDVTLNVGDSVVVSFGKDPYKTGKIVKIECFPKDKVPFPIEKTKKIGGKVTYACSQYPDSPSMIKAHWHSYMWEGPGES